MDERTLSDIKRDLTAATRSLEEPGAGALATLECRVDGLRNRFLMAEARNLADLEARLELIREMVQSLGPRGFLLDVVEATLADVRRLVRS